MKPIGDARSHVPLCSPWRLRDLPGHRRRLSRSAIGVLRRDVLPSVNPGQHFRDQRDAPYMWKNLHDQVIVYVKLTRIDGDPDAVAKCSHDA